MRAAAFLRTCEREGISRHTHSNKRGFLDMKTNKFLSLVLALALILTLIPAVTPAAKAASIPTQNGAWIFANGTPVVIKDVGGVTGLYSTDGTITYFSDISDCHIYGGWENADYIGNTSVTMESGTLTNYSLFGGSRQGNITGNTNVTITGGTVGYVYGGGRGDSTTTPDGCVSGTATVTIGNATIFEVYGGGSQACAATGSTNVTINGGTTIDYLCGGGFAGSVTGGTKLTINGGTLPCIVGGGNSSTATVGGDTDITIGGNGVVTEIYGGGWAGNVTGNTNVNITGGTLNSHIYGGGVYSNVGGTANVTVGSGVTYNGLYNIYGGSGAVGTVGNTKVTVNSGDWSHIFGGSGGWDNSGNPVASAVNGTAEVIIGGNATVGSVYGSANGNINGTSKITIEGNATVEDYVYGGADSGTSTVGNVELTIGGNATIGSGGVGSSLVYGGGNGTDVIENVVISIQDNATIKADVYGGGNHSNIGGNVTINFWGGNLRDGVLLYSIYSGGMGTGVIAGTNVINVSSNLAQWENYGFLYGTIVDNFSLDYNANGGTGTAPAQVYKIQGETFTAASNMFTAPIGKQFKEWNAVASGGATTAYAAGATVTMPNSALTLYAIWENLPTYAVTFSVTGGNGSLTARADGSAVTSGALVQQGKNVVFTANPDTGYRVKAWKDNGAAANGTNTAYTLSGIAAIHTVTVEFELIPATDDDPTPPPTDPTPSPPPVIPTLPVNGGAARVNYAQSGGTVTLSLNNSKIAEILDTSNDGEAVFDLTGVKNAEAAVLSADAVKAFGGANVAVTFIFPNATVTLGPETLETLATQAGRQAVTVEASVVPPEDLTKMQAAQVRGYGAVVN
ncbi:MAG: hypothetical protein LBH95_05190, partial [Oscillospiraceae bacterium]|nr:hypothetical protein [Oscillospiraceae bacterium]